MTNPSIEELQNPENFELIAELGHSNIKEFVLEQLGEGGRLVFTYMIYQALMMVIGIFFLTRSIVLAFQAFSTPLVYTLAALVFSFSFLIPIHELLHGIALKITGAKKIYYGAYFRKFIFYAEADRHVLNKKEFELVALTPFVAVKAITLLGILIWIHSPVFYFMITIMAAHSFFCAGDIGLLTIFYRHRNVYTYDVRAEKRSFYFKRR